MEWNQPRRGPRLHDEFSYLLAPLGHHQHGYDAFRPRQSPSFSTFFTWQRSSGSTYALHDCPSAAPDNTGRHREPMGKCAGMKHAELRRLYLLVLAVHLGLLCWLPFFPSQDGPTHLYNALILRDLANGGAVYGAFFDATLFFTPNLGAAVPLYLLTAFLPPLVAEKVFLSTFMGLLVLVVPKLARLTGSEPFPASFLVFPLLFSRLTLPGFYSFMLGVPLWLLAMWLFWRMRPFPLWQRSLASNACALVMFACHLLPFGCYVLACGCAVLSSSSRKTLWPRLREAMALLALPLLLLGGYGLLMVRNTGQGDAWLNGQNGSIGALIGINFLQDFSAVLNLLTFEQVSLSPHQFVSGVLLGFLLLWLLCPWDVRQSRQLIGPAPQVDLEHRMARRWLLLTGAALFGAMLCVPDRIGELSLVKMRFGPLILLLVIPLLSSATRPAPLQRFLLCVALTVALANGVLLSVASYQVQTFVTSLPLATVRGHFVAGYRGKPPESPIDPLAHATSYYCAQHGCVDIDNYQAHSQQFFVRFKQNPSLAVFDQLETAPTTVAWERYPDVKYLLGWELGEDERTRIGKVFTMLEENGALSLWHRKTTESVR